MAFWIRQDVAERTAFPMMELSRRIAKKWLLGFQYTLSNCHLIFFLKSLVIFMALNDYQVKTDLQAVPIRSISIEANPIGGYRSTESGLDDLPRGS